MSLVELGVQAARWILVLFSVVSVGVMVESTLNLRKIARLEEAEFRALRTLLTRGENSAAQSNIAASNAPSVLALQEGLELRAINPDAVSEAIAQGIEVQCAALQGHLPILATVASTAPYIGLFGTVLGILSAFAEIARTGQTGASVVAAPIAEALTATALGLGVAIPAVMAYNYFSGRVNDLGLRVETHALDLAARMPAPKVAVAVQEAN
ncbi:protein TolQ [Abditibacteriota bacterium]|nr:protein TolQ [Abditibacteriota bacterium]